MKLITLASRFGITDVLGRFIGAEPEGEEEMGFVIVQQPPEIQDEFDSPEDRKERHDAAMADFRWEQRIKDIEREAPIPIFITQEHITAEGIKEDQIIEQILSAAYFPEREVHIYVNTYGGDVHTMFAIMDAIQSLPNTTKTIGIGKIMSAGGPILLSADIRSMTSNSFLMIHDISSIVMGSPDEMKREIEFIDKLKGRFAEFVSKRSKLTPQNLFEMMSSKGNHYFSADEALAMGLIDEIIGSVSFSPLGSSGPKSE